MNRMKKAGGSCQTKNTKPDNSFVKMTGQLDVLATAFYGVGCQDAPLLFAELFSFCIQRPLPRGLLTGSHLWIDVVARMVIAA